MTEQQFYQLIDPDQYQVFLMHSACSLPVSFASHPWFVVSKKGVVSRWEILATQNNCDTSWGHLHLNYLGPTEGINIIYGTPYRWPGKYISHVSGGENSLAHEMIKLIEKSPEKYPYNYSYQLSHGPNSNSYAAWVIAKFPECQMQLPWNSFGKKFQFPG